MTTERNRPLWFVRLAGRLGVPPIGLATVVCFVIAALTPLVERISGPIDYVRRDFESWVPLILVLQLPCVVATLTFSERWASHVGEALRSYSSSSLDPFRYPPSVTWAAGPSI